MKTSSTEIDLVLQVSDNILNKKIIFAYSVTKSNLCGVISNLP